MMITGCLQMRDAYRVLQGHVLMLIVGAIALTSVSTRILSNNATALLMVPIAVSMARELGVDPRPVINGVCIGASACYATPIGYQTNLLVYAPADTVPLNLIVLVMGSLLIPWIWPF